jgi:hypothetical protein
MGSGGNDGHGDKQYSIFAEVNNIISILKQFQDRK